MKRANHLYERIATHENLREAFRKAAKGKQINRGVLQFRKNFDANIQSLREQILDINPDIGHYHFFVVRDPKIRRICAASFPERVLHHAVMNICEPVFDSYAIFDSYACRKGKGNRKALARTQKFMRRFSWYLKLDIRKYFDSIDHTILMRHLAGRFKEKTLLTLFQKILNTYHTTPGKGLPIGNLVSQHFANFYLGSFDHWVKESRRSKGYLRYMDDFILFFHDKLTLKSELAEIKNYLSEYLGLVLKQNIQINKAFFGVPFLGFRVYPGHIRLLPQSSRRFVKKLREYEAHYYGGRWTERELIRHMEPLVAFTDAGDTKRFRRFAIQRFGVSP